MTYSIYYEERDEAFYAAYKKALGRRDVRSSNDAIRAAIHTPTDRYWMSVFQAYRYVLLARRGERPRSDPKQRLVESLYKEFQRMSLRPAFKGCSTFFIVQFTVGMPAPEFYISFRTARRIVERKRHEKRLH